MAFNLLGFNQSIHYLHELCLSNDIKLIQEHLLPPFDLNRLNESVPNMLVFTSSVMNDADTADVLRRRPFGGVAILVGNKFKRHVKLVVKSSRYITTKIGTTLIVNVFLQCQNTNEIEDEYINCLASLLNEICNVPFKHIIIGGDWNIDLNKNHLIKDNIKLFVDDLNSLFVHGF